MSGCGKSFNGNHKVVGEPLRCGVNLYWKVPGGNDKARTLEVLVCDECKSKERVNV
jgi:hypothetical protein